MPKIEAQKKIESKIARTNHLDFLYYELYLKEIPLSPSDLDTLRKAGYIEKEIRPKKVGPGKLNKLKRDYTVKQQEEIDADSYVDIIRNEDFVYEGGKKITKEDWAPKSILDHDEEFIEWINSINSGFSNMKRYKPFLLYCQQASDWLAENGDITKFRHREERQSYAYQEFDRCSDNSLYAMDKYLILKEGDAASGSRVYVSKPVHKVICFLVDAGYSFMMGKPRQIGATSTLGGIAMFKMVFRKNLFQKFITEDDKTGVEIFNDKMKFPFSELPEWMKPNVLNDSDNKFSLGVKKKKGTKEGVNSRLDVVPPTVSAINGGSPNIVWIDEAGYIKILGKMMKEARPTMFMMNEETGELEMRRQIIVWGTGGEMDSGGKAYEEEYAATADQWKKRQFNSGIIPIFFDWTTRPGASKEFYESEKLFYTTDGPDSEKKAIQFRQHLPITIEDMFLTSAKTLVSIEYINDRLDATHKLEQKAKPEHGFFEPIFDINSPAGENSDVPYKIVGAEFIPTDDGDARASATIFMQPKKNWVHRYYQGTDPIASDNGYSNMGSAIFDAHYKTLSAIVNYRDTNHKYTFLQCMLLGIYYDVQSTMGVKELIESNIGTAYIDYKDAKGNYNSMVYRTELPEHMQGGSQIIGIDNRGKGSGQNNRAKMIINKIYEMIQAYGDRIFIDTFWIQLRTFICTVTDKGNTTWGTADKRKYNDDVIYAAVFSYICSLCYDHLVPKEYKNEEEKYITEYPLVRNGDGNLTRVPVKKKVA